MHYAPADIFVIFVTVKNVNVETELSIMATVYRSRIDWWVWLVTVGFLTVIWLSAIGMSWWYLVFVCGSMTLLYAWLMFGCWYEIDGKDLVIYQFFRPTRIPISKIKSVRKTTGYLATAGMSRKRVSISFIDRSVLKSYAPLEISPNDRDKFIAHLIELNPAIREIE